MKRELKKSTVRVAASNVKIGAAAAVAGNAKLAGKAAKRRAAEAESAKAQTVRAAAPSALSSPGEPAEEREGRARRLRERLDSLLSVARSGALNLSEGVSAVFSEAEGFRWLALQCTDDEWSGILKRGHRVPAHLSGRKDRGMEADREALKKVKDLPGDAAETRAPDGVPGCFAALRRAWERLLEEVPRESVRVLTERHQDKMPPHLVLALRWLGDVDGMQFDLRTWRELERHAAGSGRTVAHYMAGVLYDHVRYRASDDGRWSLPPAYRPETARMLVVSQAALDKLERHASDEFGHVVGPNYGRHNSALAYLSRLAEGLAEGLETSVDLNSWSYAEKLNTRARAAGMNVREYLETMIHQHLHRPGGKIRIMPAKPKRRWTLKHSRKARGASGPAAA